MFKALLIAFCIASCCAFRNGNAFMTATKGTVFSRSLFGYGGGDGDKEGKKGNYRTKLQFFHSESCAQVQII